MPRIKEIFAFVAEDSGPDDEGITAMPVGHIWMPMVGADMARVNSLRPVAAKIARRTGKPVKILRFSHREELGVIQ